MCCVAISIFVRKRVVFLLYVNVSNTIDLIYRKSCVYWYTAALRFTKQRFSVRTIHRVLMWCYCVMFHTYISWNVFFFLSHSFLFALIIILLCKRIFFSLCFFLSFLLFPFIFCCSVCVVSYVYTYTSTCGERKSERLKKRNKKWSKKSLRQWCTRYKTR